MANGYVKEYSRTIPGAMASSEFGLVHSVADTTQSAVSFTSTHGQSAAFGLQWVTVRADANAYVLFGSNPTATAATGDYIEANKTYLFRVDEGDKVSFVTA